MDDKGFEKVTGVTASVAEALGAKFKVEGKPEQGPPYNGVSIRMGVTSIEDAGNKQRELNKALGEAGLIYDEGQDDSPTNSPALKTWTVGVPGHLHLEYVDMSERHGRHMDATHTTR